MAAREALLQSDLIPGDLRRIFPVCTPSYSDSANFDEVLELLHLGGRSLAHAVLMMIPEAWENDDAMDEQRRDFYRFHACLMEPWDGPASVAFTDGTVVGAVLDRNGLRPGRWWRTRDGLVVLASEAGVLDVTRPRWSRRAGCSRAGCSSSTPTAGRIIEDDEIKKELAGAAPYGDWLHAGLMHLDTLPERRAHGLHPRLGDASPADVRLHRGGAQGAPRADGADRGGAGRFDGYGHPDRGAEQATAPALRLLHPALRPGDQPAAGRDPRGVGDQRVGHDRPRGEPARPGAGQLPPDRAAVPGHRQRRAGEDRVHRRGRRPARLPGGAGQRPLPGGRRRERAARPAGRDLPRRLRGDRGRRTHPDPLRP